MPTRDYLYFYEFAVQTTNFFKVMIQVWIFKAKNRDEIRFQNKHTFQTQ